MIKNIQLKFGATAASSKLTIDDPAITIFVGPNNSGKSQVLREITDFCTNGQKNAASRILDTVTFVTPHADFASSELKRLKIEAPPSERVREGDIYIKIAGNQFGVGEARFLESMTDPNNHLAAFTNWWMRFETIALDGANRIQLANAQDRGKLLDPITSFQHLFTDDHKRKQVRNILKDALGMYFVIDATESNILRVRFSFNEPTHNERSLTDDVLTYLREAKPIDHFSDGVKAFTGIISQIIAGEQRVVFIDEPEAFLHPALAFKLGKETAKATLDNKKQLFVATHSTQFVMGAIQVGAPINIIRLTYSGEQATARLLPNDEIIKLMRNPLLRSVGVISALFYENVIVTEADADRAFYQEINERLLNTVPSSGISNALFLNAQNKQTIPSIVAPLRRLGIPAAGIADIDALKEGGQEWTKHLSAISIPTAEHQSLGMLRDTVWKKLEATGKDPKRDGGIALLAKADQEAMNNLCDRLEGYGFFLVRRGEIESWLSALDVSRNKHTWLTSIFEKMGENPKSPEYVLPSSGDVWDFLRATNSWLANPEKKGIPDQ